VLLIFAWKDHSSFEQMEKQNVTLSIPRQLLKQAKVIAARQDKSLSQFFFTLSLGKI
jgi:hypothetical protein